MNAGGKNNKMANKNKDKTINAWPIGTMENNGEKTVLDISAPQPKSLENIRGSAGNYEGMKRYWQENKKLIIGTGVALGIFAYILLGPMGGYSTLKQKWTKPLEQKVQTVEKQKKEYVNLYNGSKKKIGTLESTVKKQNQEISSYKTNMEDMKRNFAKNREAQIKSDENFNSEYFYDSLFYIGEDGKPVIQIAVIDPKKGIKLKNEFNDNFYNKESNKRILNTAKYVINDDLLETNGSDYSEIYGELEKNCVNHGLRVKDGKIQFVEWVYYDTVFNVEKSLKYSGKIEEKINAMLRKYRLENGK